MRKSSAYLLALAIAAWGPLAHAQRADTISSARVAVLPECVVAPVASTQTEQASSAGRESFVALTLGMIAANIAGQLVTSGVNALGDAIDNASAEHGYIAEGSTNFLFYDVRHAAEKRKLADLRLSKACLILWVPGDKGAPTIASDPKLRELNTTNGKTLPLRIFDDGSSEASATALEALKITAAPKVYVEAELIPLQEGMIVRPVLAWYREALPGAPKKAGISQFKATFATPSAASGSIDIGAVFASVEVPLDKMEPGKALGPLELAGRAYFAVPVRPTSGVVDATLASINLRYTAVSTLTAETAVAQRAYDAAATKAARLNTPESKEAAAVAKGALDDKTKDLAKAQEDLDKLRSDDAEYPRHIGVANVKARFVYIKDANKWGQAIAKAIKSQAATAGTAVTNELKPKAEWAATDTALLSAQIAVRAKQTEYDEAVASGAATVPRLKDELTVLKAKANEAAVAAGSPPPYPGLLASY